MLKTRELLDKLGPTDAGGQTQHPMAKMQIVVDYIATHMEGSEQDEQRLFELIYAAKKNIAETIINVREAQGLVEDNVNLHSPTSGIDNETGNIMTSMFLLAPETVFKTMTEGQLVEGEPHGRTRVVAHAVVLACDDLLVCVAVHYRNVLEVGEVESAPAQRGSVDDHPVRTPEAQYRLRRHAFVVGVDRLDVPAALSRPGVDALKASAPEVERSFEEVQYARGSPCHPCIQKLFLTSPRPQGPCEEA